MIDQVSPARASFGGRRSDYDAPLQYGLSMDEGENGVGWRFGAAVSRVVLCTELDAQNKAGRRECVKDLISIGEPDVLANTKPL